jgi:hypothetical protein
MNYIWPSIKNKGKIIYQPKTLGMKILLGLTIVGFIMSLTLITLATLPITKLLSTFFPNYVEASLRHGVVIKNSKRNMFSMTW